MSSSGAQNRRSFYRQPMYVRVDLRVAGIRIPIPSTLVDISAGGCQLHARTMLQPHVACEFNLPRDAMPPLRIVGILRKVSYTASDRTFRYAVEFEGLNEETREQLARLIVDEQRRAIAITKRGGEDPARATPPRLQELRAHRRVEVNIPIRYSVGSHGAVQEAIALDVSTGGLRMLCDQVLRQEWEIVVRFTPPNDVLKTVRSRSGSQRPFHEIRITAKSLPGVKQTRGRYMHSLVWVHPDPTVTEEIDRFVEAARLLSLRR